MADKDIESLWVGDGDLCKNNISLCYANTERNKARMKFVNKMENAFKISHDDDDDHHHHCRSKTQDISCYCRLQQGGIKIGSGFDVNHSDLCPTKTSTILSKVEAFAMMVAMFDDEVLLNCNFSNCFYYQTCSLPDGF